MKKMILAILILAAVIGVSFLVAPYFTQSQVLVAGGGCCPDRDETGTGLHSYGR
jgi:hypothetical protein